MIDLRTEDFVRLCGEASEGTYARGFGSITEALLHDYVSEAPMQATEKKGVPRSSRRLCQEQPLSFLNTQSEHVEHVIGMLALLNGSKSWRLSGLF